MHSNAKYLQISTQQIYLPSFECDKKSCATSHHVSGFVRVLLRCRMEMPRVDNGNKVAHGRLSLTNFYELWNSRKKSFLFCHTMSAYISHHGRDLKKSVLTFQISKCKRERDFGRFPLRKKNHSKPPSFHHFGQLR